MAETVIVEYCADASLKDLLPIIGKTVASIQNAEYRLTITFTDGTSITASGARWGDACLGVEVTKCSGGAQ